MPNLTIDQLKELSEIAKYEWDVTKQYGGNIEEWIAILKELGFTYVGGRWVKIVPSFASTVKQSLPSAGVVAGTTATIYETVTSPVTSIIASNTGTKVATGGVLTATSTSVGAVACAGALGFITGVNMFEAAPEFWTKVSNFVFQTDLDPEEIGQIARDTNALVMIKDGVCYMAEDLVQAIRDAFFDNGAADTRINIPSISGATAQINITTLGGNIINSAVVKDYFLQIAEKKGKVVTYNQTAIDTLNFIDTITADYSGMGGTVEPSTYNNARLNCVYLSGIDIALPTIVNGKEIHANTGVYYLSTVYNVKHKYNINFVVDRETASELIVRGDWEDSREVQEAISYGKGGYTERYIYTYLFSTNAEIKGLIAGITPDGTQGTKDQTLDEAFPEWVKNAITTIGDTPDVIRRWLPVTLPSTLVETEGTTLTSTEAKTGALPKAESEAATQITTNTKTDTTTKTGEALTPTPLPTPLPDITPTPDDPSLIGGGGSLTGLANLYNPTLTQVKEFSRWLWGSDGLNLDQLKKLLQDPMQAIIGLHVLYATPTTGDERGIQVGYINSGVNSKIVTEQYITVDCGTVTVPEYYGDARDYSPFTQVYCYLPFIGIVELNADDVINSKLSITYKVDVLTGTCLAQLKVQKYSINAVLYTYTGNAAVQMPITSGSYLSTVASLISTVGGVIATAATGGALAPVVAGAAAGAASGAIKSNVAMSGSLGANAGAMGIRKPYLIIKRQEQADASGYGAFYGLPTNKRVTLSEISGYCRVKDINLSVAGATEEEQQQIIALLKEGVIL